MFTRGGPCEVGLFLRFACGDWCMLLSVISCLVSVCCMRVSCVSACLFSSADPFATQFLVSSQFDVTASF